jgi:hypothetical protein
MGATSVTGVGQGSVEGLLPKIVNGVVKKENIQNGDVFENISSDILISTADGTAGNDDASSITIQAGDGYPLAVDPTEAYAEDGDDADGGDVNIYAGAANGEGEGGDINIQAGNTGNGPDANAGDVTIRGGNADNAENSDAGDVNIYGGSASSGIGDSDGGDINIAGGNAGDDGQAGDVYIRAGNSGNGDNSLEEDGPEAGDIEITAGDSLATTDVNGGDIFIYSGVGTVNGRGGDIEITTGNSVGDDRAGDMFLTCGTNSGAGRNGHIYIQSMPIMPVYAGVAERNIGAGVTATNGMFCYNTEANNVQFYINGAWSSFNIIGATGATGTTGATGATGATGG